MKDPNVIFSGYRMPHPLENRLELRVQTDSEGNYTPEEALDTAIKDLIAECTFLEERYKVCGGSGRSWQL